MSPTPLHYFGPEDDRDQVVVPMARAPRPDGPRQTGVSTINRRTLGRRWIAASVSAHLLIVAALLLGLFQPDQPVPPPVLKITLVQRGPGGEGASGGGGKEQAQPAAQTTAPDAEPPAAEPPQPAEIVPPPPEPIKPPPPPTPEIPRPPPPEIPKPTPPIEIPKPASTPAPPVVVPPPPQVAVDVPPPKPRHVPPRRQTRQTPPSPAPSPAPTPVPAPPTQTAVAAPGASNGPSATAGPGKGAVGAGKGAIGTVAGPGDDYLERLYRHLLRYKKYPPEAISAKLQGSVVIGFTIARDGTVSGARIEKSSGSPILDQATLALVQHASPAPPLPDSYKGNEARVKFPIDYKLSLIDQMF